MNREITVIVIVVLSLYLLLMTVFSLRGRSFAGTFSDRMIAGKQASFFLLTGSAMGLHIGSGFVIGGAEYGAAFGLGGAWYGIGCGLSFLFVGCFLTKYIYRHGYISLADYFTIRYKDYSTRLVYSVSTIFSCIAVFAGQLLAGKAVFYVAGIDGNLGIVITAVISLAYTLASGLWGALAAAFVQTVIIFIGMLLALILMTTQNGIGMLGTTLPISYFSMVPFGLETIVKYTVPTILAAAVSQGMFQRVASARTEKAAIHSNILAGLLLIPIAFIPVILGMYARCFYPEYSAERSFVVLLTEKLPAPVSAVFLAAVICAVIASCNTAFVSVSTNLIHDIVQGILDPAVSEKKCRLIMATADTVVCAIGIYCAISMNSIIDLLSLGYTFLSAGCLIPFLGGILWKRGNARGAAASAVFGITAVLLDFSGLVKIPFSGVFPLLPAFVGYVAVSFITKDGSVSKG